MTQNFWETNAEPWAYLLETQAIPSRAVTNSAILDQIKKLEPKSVLDVGCGEGWMAKQLNDNIQYFGIDGSAALIQIATKQKNKSFEVVTYSQIADNKWTPLQKFEMIIFNFSILDDFSPNILKNLKKLLHHDGQIIIQTLHPCFQKISYMDQLQTEDFKTTSKDFTGSMIWQHRTLSTWFKLFSEADLYATEITEPLFGEIPASIIFNLKAK